jgi:hypothetical protein
MSMLTPLGSQSLAKRPRRWRTLFVVIVVLAVVAAAGYGLWRWVQSNDEDDQAATSPSRVCRTPAVQRPHALPHPVEISVTVANGTDRPGLALEAADALAERGFHVRDIGNTDKPVNAGVAKVRYETGDLGTAITIAAFVPGSQLQKVQRAPVPALWLGPEFSGAQQGIAQLDEADPDAVELPSREPTCRPSTP